MRGVWLGLLALTVGVGVWTHWSQALTDPWARADVVWGLGMHEQALPLYRQALAAYPHDSDRPIAEYRVAQCLQKIGDHDAAERAYREFSVSHPDHPLREAVEAKLQVYSMAFVE